MFSMNLGLRALQVVSSVADKPIRVVRRVKSLSIVAVGVYQNDSSPGRASFGYYAILPLFTVIPHHG